MKFEFSAGGVVYKHRTTETKQKSQINTEILLGQHSGHHGWVFPKGIIGDHVEGESKESTAVREVQEETGILAEIEKSLTPVTFWYNLQGEKIKKTVYYFIMKYVSGDTKNHDWEMENVEWLEFDKVEARLTYTSDKKVWKEAKDILSSSW